MATHRFASVSTLIDADERSALTDTDFDDALWLLLAERINSPAARVHFKEPVFVYFASRYMEWEVGNGGFAQAVFNIPEWFEAASWAYRLLGLPDAAALIDEASALMQAGENRDVEFTAKEIGDLFAQFSESALAKLDARVNDVG